MEVIQLDDDDDDFIQSVNPTATRKSTSDKPVSKKNGAKDAKVTKRPPPISTRIDSDPILKASTSSSNELALDDECPICSRDLRLLNAPRRTLHLNSCLDDGEAKSDLSKKMDTWHSTMDCPICKTPLAAGPFRSAHLKKCARENAINGKNLLNLVTTQEKVTENRRKRSLPHTSAKTPKLRPKKVSKLDGEPKSMEEEEILMAKALSASMMEEKEDEKRDEEEEVKRQEKETAARLNEGVSPQFTRIINENIRKRRSYAVVELAPRSCKCDVIELIQSRFLRLFKARKSVLKKVEKRKKEEMITEEKKGEKEGESGETVKEGLARQEKRMMRRVEREGEGAQMLSRLDALSWSYRKLASDGEQRGDVTIDCSDGQIRAFSWSLLARTSALGRGVGENPRLSIDQPTTVVRCWLHFVYCAGIEWRAGEENEGVRKIARVHGPDGLVEECARMEMTRREYRGFGGIGSITEREEEETPTTKTTVATVSPLEEEEEPQEVPDTVVEPMESNPPAEEEDPLLPCDDARGEEKEDEEGKDKEDGTMDSEGSMTGALKECAAARPAAAQSSQEKRDSFLATLTAAPIIEIVEITVTTPTCSSTRQPPPTEEIDSFLLDSIDNGKTPERKKKEKKKGTVAKTIDEIEEEEERTEGPLESTSMDESDAMRDILDVSVLRRSPKIRVESADKREEKRRKEKEEQREKDLISPELFDDDDDDDFVQPRVMSHKVPTPSRKSLRRSTQSIKSGCDTVTPTTRRSQGKRSILSQTVVKRLDLRQEEVITLDDSPAPSPVAAVKSTTVVIKESSIDTRKKEEETTVDETFPRAEQPSYGGGGMDTVDQREETAELPDEQGQDDYGGYDNGGDYGNDDGGMDYADEHVWNDEGDYGGGGGGGEREGDEEQADVASRAQEEVDSFLQSLNGSPKIPTPRPTEEVDSFLLSLRFNETREKEEKEKTNGDILAGLSPLKKAADDEDDAARFKTPTLRGGRGGGRGGRGRGGRGAAFGSHVKVLKWSNVTPKPRFEAMDDDKLKSELARYGLRPMGRKRAIAMLSEIYEQTHPVVDESAAAVVSSASGSSSAASLDDPPGPSKSTVAAAAAARSSAANEDEFEEQDDEDHGERTLNRGADSSFEEEDSGEGTGAAEESMYVPAGALKGVDNQLVLFLEWLRLPVQKDLYDHVLALKPVSLEELELKLKRADSALCGISKKVLMCVLDRLHITYSLPGVWRKPKKGK